MVIKNKEKTNKEKKKLAIVAAIFLLVFIPFGLPATAGLIFDSAVENEVKRYVRLQFLFGGGSGDRNNRTKHIHVDSLKIQPGAEISYVVGEVKNTSSETFEQVQLNFYLYDSSGQKVGEAMDYKEEMGPNTPWNLKAACQFTGQSTNVARATLVEVIVR